MTDIENGNGWSVTKGYADTPMGQVHYRQQGEGIPLLLLHQTAWSSLQFSKAQPFLSERGVSSIALDTPGFGMSDGPSMPPGVEDYAEVIPAVMEHLGLERVCVCGHHTGASIAAAFALEYPGMVDKLILHGAPLYDEERRKDRLSRPHFDQTPKEDGSHLTERWRIADNVVGSQATSEAIHWSVVQFFWAGPNEWFGHHAAFKFDLEPVIRVLVPPTLIISNTGDSLHAIAHQIMEMRPDFSYTELEGGTYHIIFENPESWAVAVTDYIKEREG